MDGLLPKKNILFTISLKALEKLSHYAILVVVKSLLSISINWSVTTRYYLIFEVINCQREHISEINFDIVKYTAYVWSTRGCHRGGGGATVAWWPGGGKAWWRRWHGGTPAAAMAAARGNLDERKPLFEARNRILWLATVSRMPAPSSKISRSPKFSAQWSKTFSREKNDIKVVSVWRPIHLYLIFEKSSWKN